MPRRTIQAIHTEALPADNDPRWRDLSQPLLDFLSRPRSWETMEDWYKKRGMDENTFRNALVWLELRHLIRHEMKRRGLVWHRAAPKTKARPRAPDSEDVVSLMLGAAMD